MPEFGAGKLRDLVAFEESGEVATDGGITIGAWTERFQRRVSIESMRGNEVIDAQRLQGVNPLMITVRASADTRSITSAWRIRHVLTGVYYNIRSVVPKPDREWIELVCQVGVAVNG